MIHDGLKKLVIRYSRPVLVLVGHLRYVRLHWLGPRQYALMVICPGMFDLVVSSWYPNLLQLLVERETIIDLVHALSKGIYPRVLRYVPGSVRQ